jgi:uncharacterized protein
MLDETTSRVIQKYVERLEATGIPVSFVVMFGSQAKGTAGRWSDIDLVIVSPRFDGRARRADIDSLWISAGRIDSRIEPISCGEREWLDNDSNVILEVARREGVKIMPARRGRRSGAHRRSGQRKVAGRLSAPA